ncbi:MAG: hypothetical protein ACFFD4_10705 [Candidatus Odinarchaeota archaeon]
MQIRTKKTLPLLLFVAASFMLIGPGSQAASATKYGPYTTPEYSHDVGPFWYHTKMIIRARYYVHKTLYSYPYTYKYQLEFFQFDWYLTYDLSDDSTIDELYINEYLGTWYNVWSMTEIDINGRTKQWNSITMSAFSTPQYHYGGSPPDNVKIHGYYTWETSGVPQVNHPNGYVPYNP